MAALLKKHIAILSFIFGISISTILTSFWTFSSSWSLVKQQKDDFLIDIDNPTNDENTNKERIDYNNIKDTKVPSGDIDILDELNILSGGDKSVGGTVDNNDTSRIPSHNLGLCPIEDLFNGRWVNVTYDVPAYTPMKGQTQSRTCENFKPDENHHTYRWKPDVVQSTGCTFANFNEESYCEVMKNKTVAIVGDSISYDNFLSLTHLLGVPQSLPKAMNKNALQKSIVCQNTSTLIGHRDFYLHGIKHVADNFFPDVMVINRGAHYVADDELLADMNQTAFPHLEEWQNNCKLKGKDCLLIWRTTSPGHPNCKNYTKPATSVAEIEEILDNFETGYHWNEFHVQNKLMKDTLKHTNLTYEVMDAYYVNILRPDLHKNGVKNDCLHTCLPDDDGYSWLLHHMLLVKYNYTFITR